MGKSKGGGGGGSSWFSAVKKAFRSPAKDTTTAQTNKKNSRKSSDDNKEQEPDEDEKKREKRRWLFRKHSSSSSNNHSAGQKIDQSNHKLRKSLTVPPPLPANKTAAAESVDHRHAIAVAAATAAAAEAAVATAQAAVEIIRLTRPSSASNPPTSIKQQQQQQHNAAITIQKAFRGYLARRALVALRGIVKLQAVIRGQNVRKQAQMTLRCMQALLRLQTRMHHHPHHEKRLSQDGDGNGGRRSRKSMFAESTTNSFWDSKSVPERKSMSTRDRRGSVSSIDWNWNWNDDCPRTLQELEECLQYRKEAAAAAAALQRETTSSSSSSLAYAFSQKIWNHPEENEDMEVEDQRTNWLEQWMETKQLGNSRRFSTDHKRDSFVKTVEMDTNHNHNVNMTTPKRYSASLASSSPANNVRKMRQPSPHSASPSTCPSPGRGLKTGVQAPTTPSPLSKAKPAGGTTPMRTPSPRSYSAANTPSLRSMQRLNTASAGPRLSSAGNNGYVPNYMAATASAKARVRSQSAPRQRPSTPERDPRSGAGSGSAAFAKKRLSFPVPPTPIREGCEAYSNSNSMNYYSQNLRSPSFKSMQAGYVGMEQQSCYTDSINGGEISPCSTTELRWWFR